uniref:ATP-binding protein n=1 Tax=Nocardioides jensenii TaxID=1843 RepID=UPI000A3E157A
MPQPHPVQRYPFSAVVGSDDMALALVLTTISPSVGGVLVRGEKGTAKSTMVRALAAVLPPIEVIADDRFSTDPHEAHPLSPDGPFAADADTETRPVRLVELPVGATEDRVLGSLHLEKALSSGVAEYEPGLLARAHRGILYVDEVNLLHDHLVDLLLDAAAMGRSTVERDGVSVEHAARFVLVGTMNPEEGELRPQLLDRFGLTVEIAAPRDPALRVEVVRRRIAFETDPAAFAASYADAERALTDRILAAQKLVDQVHLGDAALLKIAEICAAFDVDGMRADIVTARAAIAHAAWHGRTTVAREDVR